MIERFRGVKLLAYDPVPGVNCIVGPADAGKSTLLAAIELLLAPWHPTLFEFDYWRRKVEDGFQIQAVLAELPEEFTKSFRVPPLQGWKDGQLHELPENGAEPVVVVTMRGQPDFEAEHVLIDSSGAETRFTVGHRQQLRATRLNWDRTDIELRLSRGSLLQQHLGQRMRGSLTGVLAEVSEHLQIPSEVGVQLDALRDQYGKAGLPSDLHLGLQSPRRESLLGLLGLVAGASHADAVPLSLAGSGTKRSAAFELAMLLGAGARIFLVDEPEVGIEPYRQRRFVSRVRELVGGSGQAFLTTHSPAVLSCVKSGEVVRLTPQTCPTRLKGGDLDVLLRQDPEAFLARFPILCEGPTEAGLVRELLPHLASLGGPDALDALGIRAVSRTGQPHVLNESRALADSGIHHGLFVDNEERKKGTRKELGDLDCVELFEWQGASNIEAAVAQWLPDEHIEELFELAAKLNPRSVDDLRQAVCERASRPSRLAFADLAKAVGAASARQALAAAMNDNRWFKSVDKGSELGRFLIRTGLPTEMRGQLQEFSDRIKALVVT